MARRKARTTTRPKAKPGVRKRIFVPQPPERPLKLHARDVLRREIFSPDFEDHVLHRRGPERPLVGLDPREERAVPEWQVKGTLPERILYKTLVDDFRFVPGIDFDFQSSLDGGRLELGGIVADFLFQYLRLVIQVQGPTHGGFLRQKKDEEQFDVLAEFGYTTEEILDTDIYNADELNRILRKLFIGSSGQRSVDEHDAVSSQVESQLDAAVSDLDSAMNDLLSVL